MPKETIDPMEPVLFTNLSEKLIGKSKPSEFIKMMEIVATDYYLHLKRQPQYNTVKKIIINSVRWN